MTERKVPDPQPGFRFHGAPFGLKDVDTSPTALGLDSPQSGEDPSSPKSQSRVLRAVEKTVDMLGRSLPSLPPSPASPKRVFSLNRKGKEKSSVSRSVNTVQDSKSPQRSSSLDSAAPEDSPFIRPPSPPLSHSRPTLSMFQGEGSMRAGTQTLIQALQAIPWSEDNDSSPEEDGGSDDEEPVKPLASSIHTIHRPVARNARSRRLADAFPGESIAAPASPIPEVREVLSDSDDNDEDFEATPQLADAARSSHVEKLPSPPVRPTVDIRRPMSRTGSMATVRLQRRARLAEKLQDVFEIEGIDEVIAEMPCWLLRSILLQGYMYLTNSYLCFFAHMPSREDQVLKSGSLYKKAQRTKRWIKHWFVLKNDALSWYQSSYDPYFPHGIVDLRYAISCEPSGEKDLRIRTNQKSIHLSADSVPSREEWVKAIRKVMFKAQNMGDSVKIAIPYSAILDVEKSHAMDFSETIEVRVLDKQEHDNVDSYFFAYFHDLPAALEEIRDAVRAHRALPQQAAALSVLDTTVSRPSLSGGLPMDRTQSAPPVEQTSPRSMSTFNRLSSLLRFQDTTTPAIKAPEPEPSEEFTHVSRKSEHSFVATTTSKPLSASPIHQNSSTESLTPKASVIDHTYPPSTQPEHPPLKRGDSGGSSWSVGVPSWLKGTRRPFSTSGLENLASHPSDKVREMYQSSSSSHGSRLSSTADAFSVLDTPGLSVDSETTERFRSTFAFDEKETLLGYFSGYIFRLLPVFGRLYISTNYFCFKSSGPLMRTRMNLPIRDILSLEKSKGTRFGHCGLIVIVKGHEEIFFEFGSEDRRDILVRLLDRQIDDVRKRLAAGEVSVPTQGKRDALILEEFEPPSASSDAPMPESMTESLPAVMFTSASSTFLTFKPSKPMHFTCLTIGSRGDVQPYIALAKGLMADGHKVRIATHGEFKEWIEGHGIEFGYVGGDPAELMRICVENGTFTVSFLKEGVLKFRGWVDDLLKTSWDACQGTDVLIESPSAMGGYHIAEALGIPYFRAFTMTWSRTRAYPHAFAVPEHKMGGGYNYMTYVMFDQVFWRATAGQINRWRRSVLNIDSTSLDRMEPHKIPFLYNFSPHVVPPPLDWPEWIRVTGYWFLDSAEVSAKKWNPPDDLTVFIDNARKANKKIVYIGFGSIVVSDPRAMTRCVIEAVKQSGVYAILSKGWSDRLHTKTNEVAEPEEPLPAEIYSISSVPHDWLFQRIDAACHHGGAGTTGASLRAGIPTIIKPFFGDQLFWADRVEALGVGTGVRKLTVDALVDALISATTDTKQIDRAKLLGEQIRSENGVATAIESIYRDLEYAKSLIKKAHDTRNDEITNSPMQASGYTSSGAPSEDWSVISEQDDGSSSSRSDGKSVTRSPSSKRNSLTAAVMSVLPSSPRRRTRSPSLPREGL